MKKQYYLVAYGHVYRISEKTNSADSASRYCFGVSGCTCVEIGTRKWRYLTWKQKDDIVNKLRSLHLQKTGNLIT